MKCLYGSSLDAIAAAAVVKLAHPECDMEMVVSAQSLIDHGRIPHGNVWLVGCRFGEHTMEFLAHQDDIQLTWIDRLDASPVASDPEIRGLRADKFGVCELACQFIHGIPPGLSPRAIRLIGRYASHDRDYHPDVVPFYWGMMAHENLDACSDVWNSLINWNNIDVVQSYVTIGSSVYAYVKASSKRSGMLQGCRA